MTELKPCGCGRVPDYLAITRSNTSKYALAYGSCCNEWHVEFRTAYADLESDECMRLAIAEWNDATRNPIEDSLRREVARLRDIAGEYWQTLCHYDHDDISTDWEKYRGGAPIPPKDERYAEMRRKVFMLDDTEREVTYLRREVEELRGIVQELVDAHGRAPFSADAIDMNRDAWRHAKSFLAKQVAPTAESAGGDGDESRTQD